jgi:hypothetical protein
MANATDFLYIDVLGDRNLLRNLDQMPDTVRAILLDKVEGWTAQLEQDVAANIASKLKQQSGKLAAGWDPRFMRKASASSVVSSSRVFHTPSPRKRVPMWDLT